MLNKAIKSLHPLFLCVQPDDLMISHECRSSMRGSWINCVLPSKCSIFTPINYLKAQDLSSPRRPFPPAFYKPLWLEEGTGGKGRRQTRPSYLPGQRASSFGLWPSAKHVPLWRQSNTPWYPLNANPDDIVAFQLRLI